MSHNRFAGVSRRALVKAAGVAGLAGLAGCFDADGGRSLENGSDGVTLDQREIHPEWVHAVSAEASELSPYRATDYASGLRTTLLLDGAYTLDEDDEFYSFWVESYENRGEESYAFTLRDNLEWGNDYGQQTADDWVWFYNHVVTPEENWVGHPTRDDWSNVVSVERESELTFVVDLEKPDPLFVRRPTMWGTQILPSELTKPYYERWVDGDGDAGHELNTADEVLEFQYAGNLGPYTFDRREIEDRFVVQRNDDYYRRGTEPDADDWEDAPYFERYVMRILPEQSTRLAELRTGGITYTELPADEAHALENESAVETVTTPTPFLRLAAYNQRENGWEPFRNQSVRQAFSMAVEKTSIVENIFDGNADVAHTFQPTYSEFYDDSHVREFGEGESYDPEAARSILERELPSAYGYDGDVLLDAEGSQVALTLVYQTGERVYRDSGRYIAAAIEDLGVAVEQRAVPGDVLLERYAYQESDSGIPTLNAGSRDRYTSDVEWDIMWSLSLNTFPRSPENIGAFFTEAGTANFMGYVPAGDLEGLLEEAATAPDIERRRERFGEVFGLLSEEQPANFMIFDNTIHGYHRNVVLTEPVSPSWGYKRHTYWASEDPHG
ncbi:ABC transporter substrate-binding protein [Natronobiforma cellulositropha]|uniref:ABC transporter substrate-binding protein n=1 Tax=Natronobiforma cellulositropha TaxID=1679076 RepID=UPI0021D5E323|nr:ABC transporter substrate-binding protein [Natronobiforma cellulositropha]